MSMLKWTCARVHRRCGKKHRRQNEKARQWKCSCSMMSNDSLSIDWQQSNGQLNIPSLTQQIFPSNKFLFFAPLILCLILLISGIILFIVVGRKNNEEEMKSMNLFPSIDEKSSFRFFGCDVFKWANVVVSDENGVISCQFNQSASDIESTFALSQLNCALHRSSVIGLYYWNNSRRVTRAEKLHLTQVINRPIVELNLEFLSKLNSNSFVLLLIDPKFLPEILHKVVLHWIRYFSSTLEDQFDICLYRSIEFIHTGEQEKILLLYATNSTAMMIRGKTVCHHLTDWFSLIDYVALLRLKLIAATSFFIPYDHLT